VKFIFIQGPPGCGKHCTLSCVCKDLNYKLESSISKTNCEIPKTSLFRTSEEDQEIINDENYEIKELNKFMANLTLANREQQYFSYIN